MSGCSGDQGTRCSPVRVCVARKALRTASSHHRTQTVLIPSCEHSHHPSPIDSLPSNRCPEFPLTCAGPLHAESPPSISDISDIATASRNIGGAVDEITQPCFIDGSVCTRSAHRLHFK